ncbi:hypothetical protein H9Q69_014421, partial [Fusarium xylarioides]
SPEQHRPGYTAELIREQSPLPCALPHVYSGSLRACDLTELVTVPRRTPLVRDRDELFRVWERAAGEVDGANDVEQERIIEGITLRHLHHTQDDDQVGARGFRSSTLGMS